MRIIAFIEDEEVIKKILKHLGLWDLEARSPPRAKAKSLNLHIDDSHSQLLVYEDDLSRDFDYPIETCAN
jgi:hypothetical protein